MPLRAVKRGKRQKVVYSAWSSKVMWVLTLECGHLALEPKEKARPKEARCWQCFTGKPVVDGSIFRFEGQATVYKPGDGPCYRCLYPEPPPPGEVPSCAEGGVLGVLPGIVGVIQATEVVKLILDAGDPLVGRMLVYDAMDMKFRVLKMRRNCDCPVCGDDPTVTELIDYQQFCGLPTAHSEADIDETLAAAGRALAASD